MMWILLATLGQFLNAIVAFFDKYIVSDEKAMPEPFVYAFYTCLITGGWMLVFFLGYIPTFASWGVPTFGNIEKPTIQVVSMSFLSGYTLFMALVAMYTALKKADAVNVIPVIGAVSALVSFLLNYLLLDVVPTLNYVWGVALLSLGTLLVAQSLPKREVIVNTIHSGIFFALHYITMKGLFEETNFDDGLFWSRVGMVLFALSLLLVPAYFSKIRNITDSSTKKTGILVLGSKILSGIAAFLILKATDLGDAAVVQALDGVKFVFIFLIVFIFSSFLPPQVISSSHNTRPSDVIRQTVYIVLIAMGYFILFV